MRLKRLIFEQLSREPPIDGKRLSEMDCEFDDVVYHDAVDVPDEWSEDMFPGRVTAEVESAEMDTVTIWLDDVASAVLDKVEFAEKPAAYVPSIESAVAEMVEHSAIPDALAGSVLASVVRENGTAKSGAILKNKGRGLVFMEWETGFVYRLPAKNCKKSKSQGFTVLTLSDDALRKDRKLSGIFTARSLF